MILPTLINSLTFYQQQHVLLLSNSDTNTNLGGLKTTRSIFREWRSHARSENSIVERAVDIAKQEVAGVCLMSSVDSDTGKDSMHP
ncbi:hypothetical protein V8E53_007035, partial [Lactarius tabidus]